VLHIGFGSGEKKEVFVKRFVSGRLAAFAVSVVLMVAVASIAAGSAGSADRKSAAQVNLTIGVVAELTGSMSPFGPPMVKAGKLAIDTANKAAGQAGVDLTVKQNSADAQGDPNSALQAARTLVAGGASCLTGPTITPEAIAIAQGLTIQKHILVWPQATSTRLRTIDDKGTVFRTVPPDSLQARALAAAVRTFVKNPKGKLVSVVYRNEPYGEGIAKDFSAAWKKLGGTIQGPIAFDPTQASLDSEAGKAVENNPAAYVIADYPDTYAKLGTALLRTGKFDAKKLFVADALSFADVPSNIPTEAMEGAHGTVAGSPESSAAYKAFDRAWKAAKYGGHFSLDSNQFDATMLCILAAAAAKSAKPAAIQSKLRSIANPPGTKYTFSQLPALLKALAAGKEVNYEGASGALDLDKRGDPTTGVYDIFAFKNRKLVTVRQINAT
jgi:ABC-type branched-subunit amino acid transport system substrate-binding protein